MKIALLQINPTVGDFAGNAQLIADGVAAAKRDGAELAVTPELALAGYLPRDLLGLKVTDRAFGTDWRMPIAARTDL
jgi:predicted amidohydrolase